MLQQHAHLDRISLVALAFAFLIIASAPVLADTLLTTDFENASLPANWTVYANPTGGTPMWATINTTPHQSGGWHAQVIAPGTSRTAYLQANVSTNGYGNVNVTYWRMLAGLDGPDEYTAEWFDGTTWTAMEATGASTANDATYQQRSFVLPTGADNKTSFAIRFSCLAGAVSEICRVDNVTINANTSSVVLPPPPPPPSTGQFNYTVNNQSGKFSFNFKPYYKASNGSMMPVNNTLVPSNLSGYEYGVTAGLYEAHFKNLPSTTSSVLLRRGVDLSYDPEGLYWDSSSGNDIIDANPNGAGDPDTVQKNKFVYPNAYGTGINLTYTYLAGELKENIIVANRTLLGNPSGSVASGANLSLRADFALHNTNNLDLYVDGVLWTVNGVKTNVSSAEFRNSTDTIFNLNTPIAFDSNGSTVTGWYNFRRTLGDLWVEQHFPYSWVNSTSRVYPINLDPSTEIEGLNGTVIIDLTDNSFNPLVQMTLFNVTDAGTTNILLIDPVLNDSIGVEDYAIDPTGLDFIYGEVFVSQAQGNILYKCPTYNITTEVCEEDINGETWIRSQTITPGNNYTFNITNTDPGYYEYALATNENSTTSSTYSNIFNKTVNVTRAGQYMVLVTWMQRGDTLTQSYRSKVLFNNTEIASLQIESKDVSATNDYKTYGTHYVVNLSTGNYEVILQQASEGGSTSFVKNAVMSFFDVKAFPPQQATINSTEGNTSIGTTFTNVTIMTNTPVVNGVFMFVGSGNAAHPDTGSAHYIQGFFGNLTGWDYSKNSKDTTDYYPYIFVSAQNDTSARTLYVQAKRDGSNSLSMNGTRLSAISLLNEYDPWFVHDTGTTSTSSTSFSNITNLSIVPLYPNAQYLIIGSATVFSSGVSGSARLKLLVNGTDYCDSPYEPQNINDEIPYVCQALVNVSTTTPFNVNLQLAQSSGITASARARSIVAFRVSPSTSLTNNLLCYPLLNQNWSITEPIICDNVTRTTGTGRTIIGANGTLQLINNAYLTTTGYDITRYNATLPWYIQLQRGSNIYVTH